MTESLENVLLSCAQDTLTYMHKYEVQLSFNEYSTNLSVKAFVTDKTVSKFLFPKIFTALG